MKVNVKLDNDNTNFKHQGRKLKLHGLFLGVCQKRLDQGLTLRRMHSKHICSLLIC